MLRQCPLYCQATQLRRCFLFFYIDITLLDSKNTGLKNYIYIDIEKSLGRALKSVFYSLSFVSSVFALNKYLFFLFWDFITKSIFYQLFCVNVRKSLWIPHSTDILFTKYGSLNIIRSRTSEPTAPRKVAETMLKRSHLRRVTKRENVVYMGN